MNEVEVGEMLGMLYDRYPHMPINGDVLHLWETRFSMIEAELGFNAAAMWTTVHDDWPTVADLHDVVYRMSVGRERGLQLARHAYVAECARRGREPGDRFTQI